jgi:hypothetical protein
VVFAAVISRHKPPPPLEHAGLQQRLLLLGSYMVEKLFGV